MQFPSVDPIPLPAPVWLFKLLHPVTLALHFAAVDLLIGGLTVGLVLGLLGRARKSPDMIQASGMLAHRLPTVMAFVINLGIPPLLFAQVLYGRALYTSSVLIGVFWISVIFLLMASYYGLYLSAQRAEAGTNWMATGFAVLILVLTIGFIYSNNMTLMIRPAVWTAMYQASPAGTQLNHGDPTLVSRYHFFILGAFPVTGAALVLLALKSALTDGVRSLLRRTGGVLLAAGILLQLAIGYLAWNAQPQVATSGVMGDALFRTFVYAWLLTAALLLVSGLAATVTKAAAAVIGIAAGASGLLNVASTVMIRDGIRDYTLRAAGFEVWDRTVVTNWSVVGVFLVLFVVAIGVIAFLVSVVAKARPLKESYV